MAVAAEGNPDPRSFDQELLQILAVLARARAEGDPWLSATDIAKRLRDQHRISIHWRRTRNLLLENPQLAARRTRARKPEFSIMAAGEERLTSSAATLFVDPERAVQAVATLHDLLSGLHGEIAICDPYVDPKTIEHMAALPSGRPIRLLTVQIREENRVRRLLDAARTQGKAIEVRVAPSGLLHDRYVISDDAMLILGTSLNGFGRKQCFVTKTGDDIRQITKQAFERVWATANPWWP